MYGRYGFDSLSTALLIISLVLSFMTSLFGAVWLSTIPTFLMVLVLLRVFSKNIYARKKENDAYSNILRRIKNFFRLQKNKIKDIKTHKYFRCGNCKNTLRVPRGKGSIRVTCPVCKNSFDAKT